MAAKTKRQITEELKEFDQQAEQQKKVAEFRRPQVEPNDADTRQRIAKLFVIAYFALLGVVIIGAPLYNIWAFSVTHNDQALQLSLNDIIQTYSAVVGPTLGFVVAYYFKSKGEN